jgi:hypothetical protein
MSRLRIKTPTYIAMMVLGVEPLLVSMLSDAAAAVAAKHGQYRPPVVFACLELMFRAMLPGIRLAIRQDVTHGVLDRIRDVEPLFHQDEEKRTEVYAAVHLAKHSRRPIADALRPLALEFFHSLDRLFTDMVPQMVKIAANDFKKAIIQEMEGILPSIPSIGIT